MNDMTKFIEQNISLVYFVINKYYPSFINDDDIVQCAMVGLCKAANRWDSSKSKFSTFASSWIKNEIKSELRKRNSRKIEISLEQLLEGALNEH